MVTQSPPQPQIHPGRRLRELMRTKCVGLPGAFNGLVARAIAQAGFDGCYVSGGAISAAGGVPDIGLLSLNEFCAVIDQVARSSGLPVLADADTGFGEGEMLVRTIWEYHRAGAAGCHIEDQVFPKRCGHLEGKTLVPIDHMQEKVSRAGAARDACSSPSSGAGVPPASTSTSTTRGDFIVCARTDAAGVEGLPSAIERAKAYVDAGADMIFPEGLRSEADFESFAGAIASHSPDTFLLANMTEFGKTPITKLSRFDELGYHCVIWPVTSLRSAMGAVVRMLEALKSDGDVSASLDDMQSRDALYSLLGYTPGEEWTFPRRAPNPD